MTLLSHHPCILAAAVAVCTAAPVLAQSSREDGHSAEGPRFLPPVRLEAGGAPIDVTVGHAAPLVMDFDGDGLRDLLVGEFGEGTFPPERLPADVGPLARDSFALGKLRVYRNVGSAQAPRFEDFQYLRAGKEHASIPTT
ncbi:MAG: hypothetical protein QF903_11030 [Planctomycetota bacterium]|jgi:hypothetical protein|nr:hypothetical protein [Planctomycetota bacterium]MDP6763760.1 hypothetical protein [Planctomycetota bacterium]MDP6990003.1 hypothetical protein [Planctomycetota bacterium]